MALKTSFRTTLSHLNLYKGPAFHTAKIYCNCMHFSLGCSGASNIALLVIVGLFLVVSHLLTRSFRANEMKDSSRFFGVSAVICYVRQNFDLKVCNTSGFNVAKWYNTYYFQHHIKKDLNTFGSSKEVRFGGRGFLFSFEKWMGVTYIDPVHFSKENKEGLFIKNIYLPSNKVSFGKIELFISFLIYFC